MSNFSPLYLAASGTVSVNSPVALQRGMIAINIGGNIFYPYNASAGTFTGYQLGVVMSQQSVPGSQVSVQTDGMVPFEIFNLGPGNASYVVIGGNFLPTRGNLSPTVIGVCDKSGCVEVFPSFVGVVLSGTGNQVAGSGVWHSTTGTLDPNALVGTEGQILFTNAMPDTQFLYPTNDVSSSNTTPGKLTVVGIQSTPVSVTPPTTSQSFNYTGTQWVPVTLGNDVTGPLNNNKVVQVQGFPWTSGNPGSGNVPQFNGTSWVFVAGSSLGTSFSVGGDLTGGSGAQYIQSIGGANNTGGVVGINNTTAFNFIACPVNFEQGGTSVIHLAQASSDFLKIGANVPTITAGIKLGFANTNVIAVRNNNNTGDVVYLALDASNNTNIGTPANSPNGILGYAQGSQVLQLQATGGSDWIGFGSSIATAGYIRTDSARTVAASLNHAGSANISLVSTDASDNVNIGDDTHVANMNIRSHTQTQILANNVIGVLVTPTSVGIENALFMTNQSIANSATLGANGAVPNQVANYLAITINSTNYKIPLFNP